MDDYILVIASAAIGCSLIAVLLMYLHYRRLKRNCNKYIVKYIREQDRLKRELERTYIEKEVMENLLKSKLAETTGHSTKID